MALSDGLNSGDLKKLELGFGGFTPMPLNNDAKVSHARALASEERMRAYREAKQRAAELEAARASEERVWVDDAAPGSTWRYVVLDGDKVRIERCVLDAPAAGMAPLGGRPGAAGGKRTGAALAILRIPDAIEGKPVMALAPDACSYLAGVEEIICPDAMQSIGGCAFRANRQLRRLVLPRTLALFDSHWMRSCAALEELTLPGMLPMLDASIFDMAELKTLRIGAGTAAVAPGAFLKSTLRCVEVDEENPHMMTDGRALYSRDGSVMMALAVPGFAYKVLNGCRKIGKKGFSNFSCVEEVALPDSLEVLGSFALSRTRIASFRAPAHLRRIESKAFFNCEELYRVQLNDGLAFVGDDAFSNTRVEALRLPASVEAFGNPLAAGAPLAYAGAGATFSIDEASPYFMLDEHGGLYRRAASASAGADGAEVAGAGGMTLVRMMDPKARAYRVVPGAVAIEPGAFAKHAHIEQVELPEGLAVVGAGAFKDCRALRSVQLPEGLERIEDEAFLDTSLEALRLPRSLAHLGALALVTHGAHHGKVAPSLRQVEVAPGNERFYLASGLLLERMGEGSSRVLLCTDAEERVVVPAEVTAVAPYAFNGARNIRELVLSDRITSVGARGLAVDCLVERIHIDLEAPLEGHASFDVNFPAIDRSVAQIGLAFSLPDRVDVASIFEHYDNTIIQGCNYDAKLDGGLSVYEQSTRILERLRDPVFLTQVNRNMCERILSANVEEICVALARHDDRRALDMMLDFGYVHAGNIDRIIECVGAVQDAATTGYLLEAKRQRFGRAALDFDL